MRNLPTRPSEIWFFGTICFGTTPAFSKGELSRHFQWLVGVQITTLVAIVGALLARS